MTDLSPYTGWSRATWAALADRMLAALDPYRSPTGARIDLPGPASRNGRVSDGLEGFARSFLLAGFRVAGETGDDPGNLLERYAAGLAAGTDPGSAEAWPRPDELDQSKVEAASIALVLQLTKPWLWDRLDDRVRERTVDWLGAVVGQSYPPINWVWFRLVVESFLREAGGPWSAADIEQDLAVHASLRRPDGWLSDGEERAYDHYTGWALHVYPLLWTHLFDVENTLCPPALRKLWETDLQRYLEDAVRLIGADGSPLLQGRSLAYRFAAAAPFWVGAFTDTGLSPGLTRRVASGMVRHFADHEAFEPDGLLGLGWHRDWPAIRQAYSGPGSPYWAMKGMLGLALPTDHPVWTDTEEPLPIETGDVTRIVTAPGWLVSARREEGIAIVLNHGTDHAAPGDRRSDSPLYARLGYSTATVPPLTGPTVASPLDNSVVLLDEHGRASHRAGFETCYTTELPGGVLAAASRGPVRWVDTTGDDSPDHGSGRSGPVIPGPVITVVSVLREGIEIRLVRVDTPCDTGVRLRLGGWPVAADLAPACGVDGVTATARTADLRSVLRGLRGFTAAEVFVEEGTSPLGARTAIPLLSTSDMPAPGVVLAAAVLLDRGGPEVPAVEVDHNADEVTLTWPDGVRSTVPLP